MTLQPGHAEFCAAGVTHDRHTGSAPAPPDGPLTSVTGSRFPWVVTWVILLSLSATLNAGLIWAAGGRIGFFLPVMLTCACILAALFDGSTGRIPNPLTYTVICLGLALNALASPVERVLPSGAVWLGAIGAKESLMGFGACAGLGLLARAFAGIHGGDLKLLAAFGAVLGLSVMAGVALLALGIALIYAAANLVVLGRLNTTVRIAAQRALELVYLRRFITPVPDASDAPASHIPMALPMALALIVTLILQWRGGAGGLP